MEIKSRWQKEKQDSIMIPLLITLAFAISIAIGTFMPEVKAGVDERDQMQRVTDNMAEAYRLYLIDGEVEQLNRAINSFNIFTSGI